MRLLTQTDIYLKIFPSLLNYVPDVLCALLAPMPYVPPSYTWLLPYVFLWLRCLVPYVPSCLACLVFCVLFCLMCLVPYMLSRLTCLRCSFTSRVLRFACCCLLLPHALRAPVLLIFHLIKVFQA